MNMLNIVIIILLIGVAALLLAVLYRQGYAARQSGDAAGRAEEKIRELESRLAERDRLIADAHNAELRAMGEETLRRQTDSLREANTAQLDLLLKPLHQRLQEFNRACTDAYVKENAGRTALADRIDRLADSNRFVAEEARRLSEALRGDNRAQGRWGEVMLERLLEKAGLEKGINYAPQATRDASSGQLLTDSDSGRAKRPDMLVYLPGGHTVIIDSKVSLTAYLQWSDAPEGELRREAGKKHVASMRKHVKELAAQGYQRTVPGAAEHVLMFVPNEGAYLAALSLDDSLTDYACENHVAIVSPAHLLSVLHLIAQIWQTEQRSRNAEQIAHLGGLLYDKFASFLTRLKSIENGIANLQKAYDGCVDDLSRGSTSILRRSERLREMGAKTSRKIPESFADKAGQTVDSLPDSDK